ncbi:hypothetical protein DPSP01_010891 [Paraphaeosphaeria sporulosa]
MMYGHEQQELTMNDEWQVAFSRFFVIRLPLRLHFQLLLSRIGRKRRDALQAIFVQSTTSTPAARCTSILHLPLQSRSRQPHLSVNATGSFFRQNHDQLKSSQYTSTAPSPAIIVSGPARNSHVPRCTPKKYFSQQTHAK